MAEAGQVMGWRALGRALLARQHLLTRRDGAPLTEVEHLVGQQSQNPGSPYTALWSRLVDFDPLTVSALVETRELVRVAAMRGTIHLVSAADALVLPLLMAPVFERDLRTNSQHAAGLRTLDLGALADKAARVLAESPRSPGELGVELATSWPDVPPASLAYGARGTLSLVQVPPRGLWGRPGATTWTTTRAWLGAARHDATTAALVDDEARDAALETLALRYLAAFGPASVADLQRWSGLTGLRTVMDRLRPQLVGFRSEPGEGGSSKSRELFDLPDAPRPHPDTPAPARFLPDFDNVLIGHADRSRIIPDAVRRTLTPVNGLFPSTVLIDGEVAATWRLERARRASTKDDAAPALLRVSPLRRLTRAETDEVTSEGNGLLALHAPDSPDAAVAIEPTGGNSSRGARPPGTGPLRAPQGPQEAQPATGSTCPARSASRSPVAPSAAARRPSTIV